MMTEKQFPFVDIPDHTHVHVIQGEHVAKIWLTSLSVEYNHGYNRAALNRIFKLTQQYQEELLEVWNEYFN